MGQESKPQDYRRPGVKVRFALPGEQFSDMPNNPSKTSEGKVEPVILVAPRESGVSGPTPTNTKTTTRVAAGGALVILGASYTFNWIIGLQNSRDIHNALDARAQELALLHRDQPDMGILLTFRFNPMVDSGEGATATGRFQGLSYQTGRTEDGARAHFNEKPKLEASHYEFQWIPPLAPSAVPPPNWDIVARATFADLSNIKIRRVEFAQVGGFGTRRGGLDAVDFSDKSFAKNLEFRVLQLPSTVPYHGVGGGLNNVNLTLATHTVQGGTVPVVVIDGDPFVAVVAGNDLTYGLFHAKGGESRMVIDDKVGALGAIQNIGEVRWLEPDQVRVLSKL